MKQVEKEIPCQCTLGETEMTIEKLSELSIGQVIPLNVFADESVELVIGGRLKVEGAIVRKDGENVFIAQGDFYE